MKEEGLASPPSGAALPGPADPSPTVSASGRVSTDAAPRDPLALAMFAAWVNCDVERIPSEYRGHTCPATMEAWGRVAAAARDHLANEIMDAWRASPNERTDSIVTSFLRNGRGPGAAFAAEIVLRNGELK